MTLAANDLQESLTLYMRSIAPTGITWGATASPFYKRVPDSAVVPAFPYVVFDVPKSDPPDLNTEGGYEEDYKNISVKIVGTEAHRSLFSPYVTTNLFYLLDKLMNTPSALSGNTFKVNAWYPEGYEVDYDNEHGPNGEMVLIGERTYSARVLFNQLG